MKRYRSAEYGLARSFLDRSVPLLKLPLELIRVVWQSDLPWASRLTAVLALVVSCPVRYFAGQR